MRLGFCFYVRNCGFRLPANLVRKLNMEQNLEFDEILIDLVEKYSILYDKKSKGYRNKQMKANCWREISNVTGKSGKLFLIWNGL